MQKKIGILLAVFFAPFLYLSTELYNFRSAAMVGRFVWLHGGSALLGLLLVTSVFVLFAVITRRIWIGACVSGSLFWIMGLVHFLKTALNGDPFVPWDLSMLGSMDRLVSFVKWEIPWWGFLIPLLIVGWIVALARFCPPLPRGLWYRLATAAAIPVLLIGFISGGQNNFLKFGMSFMDAALQSSNYKANGLVSAFYLNLATMQLSRPEGYSAKAVETAMAGAQATTGKTPDIVVVLCESFWDVRKLSGTTFSVDPLARYDALCEKENTFHGTLYTSAIGGGTVRTEFAVLSGLSAQYLPTGASPYIYPTRDVATHVSHWKSQGYDTVALHPYDTKFYARAQGYPFIGFDAFYGQSEIEQMVDVTYERGYVSDDSFVDALIQQLESADEPLFLWGISMENHQTYYPLEETAKITVSNPHLSKDLTEAVTTYTQGVAHSAAALEKLYTYIQGRERETLLVFFGDHLPTLGGNHAAYAATGMFDGPADNTEQAKLMYGTPFMISANYPLADLDLPRQISDYNLLPLAAKLGDLSRSAYMNRQLALMEQTPYYSSLLYPNPDPAQTEFSRLHELITYDRLAGEQYSK